MRKLSFVAAALAACAWGASSAMAEDLEVLDSQIAQAFAQALTAVAEKVEKPQVKVEGDIEKACGVHKEQTGLLLVPQKDVSPEGAQGDAVNSDPGAPLSHMFMSDGFTLVIDGKPVDVSKLRTLTVTTPDGNEVKVRYLVLAARHTDDDVWHLYGYGSEEKPVLDAQIGEGAGPGTQPLALEVKDFEDNAGTAYLTIFDRFQCSFKVAYKDPSN
jgi:hypothetical protein